MELTLAITGASGTVYAHRTLQLLAASGVVDTINLIVSTTAVTVAQVEMGVNLRDADVGRYNEWLGIEGGSKLIRTWRLDNMAAKPSSGSNKQDGMIIVPCSMGTLGAIASGAAYMLYNYALRHMDASQAGVYTNLIPIVGVITGVIVLGEELSVRALLGGAIVMLGVWITSRQAEKAPAAVTS